MSHITVVGNINLETTVRIGAFPLAYAPTVFAPFGIHSGVSAVGYNLAKALTTLGTGVTLASLIGPDTAGQLVTAQVVAAGIDPAYLLPIAEATAQSVVLYNASGARSAITDLKNLLDCAYPPERFAQAIGTSDLVVLTNIAYSKPLIPIAQAQGKPIATDLHTISDPADPYNLPFLEAATILFMSGEALVMPLDRWVETLFTRYCAQIIVIGLGAKGAYLAVREPALRIQVPAATIRPVVQTGGAGDALFAAFLHTYLLTRDPLYALRAATVFAAYKIGAAGSGTGFLTFAELEALGHSLPTTDGQP
jgi:acarbose 7IV-phosphotransferase